MRNEFGEFQEYAHFRYEDVRERIRDLDVIAFQGRGLISRAISLVTGGSVTHVGVALWVNNSLMLLESRELRGGRIVRLSREIEKAGGVLWMAPRERIGQGRMENAREWATRAAGTGYSYVGCLRFLRRLVPWKPVILREPNPDADDYEPRFCSMFVAAIYRMLGLRLTEILLDSETSPNHVHQSRRLVVVGRVRVDPDDVWAENASAFDPALPREDEEEPPATLGKPVGVL